MSALRIADDRCAETERGEEIEIVQEGWAVPTRMRTSCSRTETAVTVLAASGVGPDTASRIVRKLQVSEDEFYADIFESGRTYVQTLRFWD